ncbi:MAG TPA: hypothetical protein VGK25_00605 [Ignavibacteria bacterium]|jgi:folate-binding protein YgfZ
MLNFYRFKQDYLIFRGNDRLDLLNRLSTNQVDSLEQNKGIKTVLTNDKGRFVDLITLYNFGDFIFSICSFNNSTNVIAHLDKYTIMDDFKAENLAGTHATILFYGDNNNKFAQHLFNTDLSHMENNDFQFHNIGDHHSIIARNDDLFGGFVFIYSVEDKQLWDKKIFAEDLKQKYSMHEVSNDEYETKRIDTGIPAYGKEMTEQTNPLECGLYKYVSFTKGCYIGQEVIARLDSYDKISKHMVKIEAEREFTSNETKIIYNNKECGFVTSAVKQNDKKHIGLGFVKTIFLDYHKEYKLKSENILIDCRIKKI